MKKISFLLVSVLCFSISIQFGFAETSTGTVSWTGTQELNAAKETVVKKLSFDWVKASGAKKLELSFSTDIDSKKELDFIVSSTGIKSEELIVDDMKVEGNKVILLMESALKSNKQYKIVVRGIYWKDGSTINSGVDGALKFRTWDISTVTNKTAWEKTDTTVTKEKEEWEIKKKDIKKNIKKNIKKKIKKVTKEEWGNLAGVDIYKDTDDSSKAWNLPTTGPEHIFFVLLALLLWSTLFFFRKKNA